MGLDIRINLPKGTSTEAYDVVIVGAGPAGLTAGLYCARGRRSTLILERNGEFAKIAGARDAWIYTFACEGLSRCAVPLTGPKSPEGIYTVSLHFAETDDKAAPGRRVFDVAVQDRTVLKGFDVAAEAGGADRAVVRTFKGIRVKGDLEITFAPRDGKPLLCGLSVRREDQ